MDLKRQYMEHRILLIFLPKKFAWSKCLLLCSKVKTPATAPKQQGKKFCILIGLFSVGWIEVGAAPAVPRCLGEGARPRGPHRTAWPRLPLPRPCPEAAAKPRPHWPLGGDPGGTLPASRRSGQRVPHGSCLGAQEAPAHVAEAGELPRCEEGRARYSLHAG